MAKAKQQEVNVSEGFDPSQYSEENLAPPVIKFVDGEPRFIKITGVMEVSTRKEKADKDGKKREPATVCACVDMITGEVSTLICTAVVRSILTEKYPADSYVGKMFKIVRLGKAEKANYNKFSVSELVPK